LLHYVALFSEMTVGGWHVQFPDLPDCDAYGFTIDDATRAATMALAARASNDSAELPSPRDLTEVQRDERWIFRNDVDLSTSVIVLIPLQRRLCLVTASDMEGEQ
jgi:predicted RNase H-like HicB family nuclease